MLLVGAEVVELQSVRTPTVATHLVPTALFGERLSAHFASPTLDGLDQVLTAISIRPAFRHPFTPPYSHLLYRLSYRGTRSGYSNPSGS